MLPTMNSTIGGYNAASLPRLAITLQRTFILRPRAHSRLVQVCLFM